MSLPRGIRNNNPGNIKHGNAWKGEVPSSDPIFETFQSPEYGIRAMVRIFRNYNKRGISTIRDVISTWAPTSENHTDAYVDFVCRQLGRSSNDVIDFYIAQEAIPFCKAITQFENGVQPYDDRTFEKGFMLA